MRPLLQLCRLYILVLGIVPILPCSEAAAGFGSRPFVMAGFFKTTWRKVSGYFAGKAEELPKFTFPDTLEGFGYHFNEKGELRDEDDAGFKFVVREGDRNYNQQHYDALGELVTEYLYNMMEHDLGLERVFIPHDAKKEDPQSFIFKSNDALTTDKLMVIIHGSGAVRAGQWSRKLIINENIDTGSQLPYIRRAIADGYGVIVMNPNLNEGVVNGRTDKIGGSESPEDHGVYVWNTFVSPALAKDVVIVAHSYGGMVTCSIAEKFLEDFQRRVFSIVYTDSVHSAAREQWSAPVKSFMKERAVNFASAYVPVDTQLDLSSADDCLSVSAGTQEHERTSHSCIDSAFKFIRDNYASWSADKTMAPRNFLPLPADLEQYSPARKWEARQAAEDAKHKAMEEQEEKEGKSAASGDKDGQAVGKEDVGQAAVKEDSGKAAVKEDSGQAAVKEDSGQAAVKDQEAEASAKDTTEELKAAEKSQEGADDDGVEATTTTTATTGGVAERSEDAGGESEGRQASAGGEAGGKGEGDKDADTVSTQGAQKDAESHDGQENKPTEEGDMKTLKSEL